MSIERHRHNIRVEGEVINLVLIDTCGNEVNNVGGLPKQHYREGCCCFIVYDVTDLQSFQDCAQWLAQIEMNTSQKMLRILVGNKSDLAEEKRMVKEEEARKFQKENDIDLFMETSAKDNKLTEEIFRLACLTILNRI